MKKKTLAFRLLAATALWAGSLAEPTGVYGGDAMLKTVDIEFTAAAKREGLAGAFRCYLAEDGIILPGAGHPIRGPEGLRAVLPQVEGAMADADLTWETQNITLARSNDLGFVMGRFRYTESGEGEVVRTGYFGIVWRRDGKGEWRLVFSQGLFPWPVRTPPPGFRLKERPTAAERELIDTELAFSRYSAKHGAPAAFHRYIAETGIAVTQAGTARRKSTFKEMISRQDDRGPSARLEWRPVVSWMAAAADLGCNTGPYTFTVIDERGSQRVSRGYFFTVWIKEDGDWKFAYDAGNTIPAE